MIWNLYNYTSYIHNLRQKKTAAVASYLAGTTCVCIKFVITPHYSWNTAKVGIKYQSINQLICNIFKCRYTTISACINVLRIKYLFMIRSLGKDVSVHVPLLMGIFICSNYFKREWGTTRAYHKGGNPCCL